MSQEQSFFEKANNWLKNSISIRLIVMGILILILLIPVSMVESLIWERQARQKEAIAEVSSKWGEAQTVAGPVLTVPYRSYSKIYDDGNSGTYKLVESKNLAHFLPEDLRIEGEVFPEVRYRGIYEVIVYNAKVRVRGSFNGVDFKEWKVSTADVIWDEAFVSFGLSDVRSIQQNMSIELASAKYFFNPGLGSQDVIGKGISTRIRLDSASSKLTALPFAMDINFNGSSSLNFVPLGKTTEVKINSGWPDPSFNGAFLPDSRQIGDTGFSAHWEVLHLNRPYPQKFVGSVQGIDESAFGIDLIVPVDEYQKSMRSAKYAVMFITLTFLVFFFVQVLNGVRIHPIQYLIVGLALCVFYTLLIALSEHIAFALSYLVSSLAIIAMVTTYAKAMFKNGRLTAVICLILTLLYLFIFSIIQMEDYSLLIGSIGLFLVLATVMYLSRKIDWYAVRGGPDNK